MNKKNIKSLMQENSFESYEILRKFYKDVIEGKIMDTRMTKDGEIVNMEPSIAVRVEAANALLRLDIDKIQGNAKARESDEELASGNDAIKMLQELAAKKKK